MFATTNNEHVEASISTPNINKHKQYADFLNRQKYQVLID